MLNQMDFDEDLDDNPLVIDEELPSNYLEESDTISPFKTRSSATGPIDLDSTKKNNNEAVVGDSSSSGKASTVSNNEAVSVGLSSVGKASPGSCALDSNVNVSTGSGTKDSNNVNIVLFKAPQNGCTYVKLQSMSDQEKLNSYLINSKTSNIELTKNSSQVIPALKVSECQSNFKNATVQVQPGAVNVGQKKMYSLLPANLKTQNVLKPDGFTATSVSQSSNVIPKFSSSSNGNKPTMGIPLSSLNYLVNKPTNPQSLMGIQKSSLNSNINTPTKASSSTGIQKLALNPKLDKPSNSSQRLKVPTEQNHTSKPSVTLLSDSSKKIVYLIQGNINAGIPSSSSVCVGNNGSLPSNDNHKQNVTGPSMTSGPNVCFIKVPNGQSNSFVSNSIGINSLANNMLVSNSLASNSLVSNSLASNSLVSNSLASNLLVSNSLASNLLVSNSLASNLLVSNSLSSNSLGIPINYINFIKPGNSSGTNINSDKSACNSAKVLVMPVINKVNLTHSGHVGTPNSGKSPVSNNLRNQNINRKKAVSNSGKMLGVPTINKVKLTNSSNIVAPTNSNHESSSIISTPSESLMELKGSQSVDSDGDFDKEPCLELDFDTVESYIQPEIGNLEPVHENNSKPVHENEGIEPAHENGNFKPVCENINLVSVSQNDSFDSGIGNRNLELDTENRNLESVDESRDLNIVTRVTLMESLKEIGNEKAVHGNSASQHVKHKRNSEPVVIVKKLRAERISKIAQPKPVIETRKLGNVDLKNKLIQVKKARLASHVADKNINANKVCDTVGQKRSESVNTLNDDSANIELKNANQGTDASNSDLNPSNENIPSNQGKSNSQTNTCNHKPIDESNRFIEKASIFQTESNSITNAISKDKPMNESTDAPSNQAKTNSKTMDESEPTNNSDATIDLIPESEIKKEVDIELVTDEPVYNDGEEIKAFVCQGCWTVFDNPLSLECHNCPKRDDENTAREIERPRYSCGHCERVYYDRFLLKRHLVSHTRVRDYTCDLCGKSFLLKHHVVTHIADHLSIRPYVCQICKMEFKRWSHLKKHHMAHTGNRTRNYSCTKCDRAYYAADKLKEHMLTHDPNYVRYLCEICKYSFATKSSLKKHVLGKHPNEENRKKSSSIRRKKELVCKFCDKQFILHKQFKSHLEHHDVYVKKDENLLKYTKELKSKKKVKSAKKK